MAYEKIVESKYKAKIDQLVEQQLPPSIIRQSLVQEGIDYFSIQEIESYVQHYFQVVISGSLQEHGELATDLSNSFAMIMVDKLDGQPEPQQRLTYQRMLELDVLRAEKMIQTIMKGDELPCNLNDFRTLSAIKSQTIHSINTFLELKKAIGQAKDVTRQAAKLDVQKLGSYLSGLSDDQRNVALDVINVVMETRLQELDAMET